MPADNAARPPRSSASVAHAPPGAFRTTQPHLNDERPPARRFSLCSAPGGAVGARKGYTRNTARRPPSILRQRCPRAPGRFPHRPAPPKRRQTTSVAPARASQLTQALFFDVAPALPPPHRPTTP
ncbi:hypothetical protein HYPSUDRAFT_205428 [Hypholoma sublateritium FD-334 SS-4]|uniref:Uncharacterized protein n=1 Tax=Hypholoma sublateritium (strain FD-334 SS-4) TaxID=945553 RepID=A0A0D2KUI1_HYPSF|nr:hypothetical protein HYPSUDRAFT_205428 [Hypholoma sublateritium FD-334 SS-4]